MPRRGRWLPPRSPFSRHPPPAQRLGHCPEVAGLQGRPQRGGAWWGGPALAPQGHSAWEGHRGRPWSGNAASGLVGAVVLGLSPGLHTPASCGSRGPKAVGLTHNDAAAAGHLGGATAHPSSCHRPSVPEGSIWRTEDRLWGQPGPSWLRPPLSHIPGNAHTSPGKHQSAVSSSAFSRRPPQEAPRVIPGDSW